MARPPGDGSNRLAGYSHFQAFLKRQLPDGFPNLGSHPFANRLQSIVLLAALGRLLALLGWLVWGPEGVIWLLIRGATSLLLNPVITPRLIMRMYGGTPLTADRAPAALHQALRELARRAELRSVPALYYLPSAMVNAFAVGRRDEAAIGVTEGLLRRLDLREVVAVLAHEMSHIRSNDLWVMGIADLFSRLGGASPSPRCCAPTRPQRSGANSGPLSRQAAHRGRPSRCSVSAARR